MKIVSAYLGYGLLFSELGLAWWRRSSQKAGSQKMDAGSLRVLWIVNLTAITASIWLALRGIGPGLPFGMAMGWIAVGIFTVGTVVRWWAIRHLGRFFTVDVAVASDHRVVDTGPYALVRHPSYSGLLLQFAGLALSLGRWVSLIVMLLPIFMAISYRIRVEEAALRRGLGEDYAAYMRRTKQLIPWLF